MGPDSLFAALGAAPSFLFFLLWLFASAGIYLALISRINARTPVSTDRPARTFGLPEAILAAVLISFLLLNINASFAHPAVQLNARNLLANLLVTVFVVLVIVTFLQLRGFDLGSLGGFFRMGFIRAVVTGAVLLFFAYPLIGLTETITQRLFGTGSSRQNIVELFSESPTIRQRVMIIVFAVAIAPVVEEFLFRFFLYGVFRRYFGPFIGTVANALLFAAAHTHLPSFAALFVLGSCFTLAYEWSSSILVAMTMHSLFNAVTLTVLAFPELVPQ
jgi:membrane protease YdiL (CAAX protease family)